MFHVKAKWRSEMLEDDYLPAHVGRAADRFIVLSGCSGSGKSSLLNALAGRGHRVFPEPGRQVIREQAYIGGDAIPTRDLLKFLELTISRTMHQMINAASTESLIFFDRSIVDQVSGFELLGIEPPAHLQKATELFRYHHRVFITPPWPESFRNDAERTHSFEDALAGYGALLKGYNRFGYELVFVPQLNVDERADFVQRHFPPS
jgi:predicted ATPase